MRADGPGFHQSPAFGLRMQIADAAALAGSDPPFPLDEKVDLHGAVLIAAQEPIDAATIAATAHWFGALGARDSGPGSASAPERLHQDFPGGRRAAYSVLYAGELPKPLPMTFVDLRRVYADLRSPLRSWVSELWQAPGSPLVAAHPRTGHPVLLPPPRRGGSLEGVSAAQSTSLIEELWAFIDASPHCVTMEVCSNDLLIWDGLATAYANPPLLYANGARFLVAPLDPATPMTRVDDGGE